MKMKRKILIAIIIFLVIVGTFLAYRAGKTITVIGGGEDYIWRNTISAFPPLPGPEEDRVDVLVVGIRGFDDDSENIYAGGSGEYLADTIILLSFNKKNNNAAIVSIPRDLYIDIPGHGEEKINSAYAIGESRHYGGGGLQLTKALISQISGVYVDYAISIDFAGFKKIIDDLGGITIYRDTPFIEDKQWTQNGRVGKKYWKLDEEKGWIFYVPKGASDMNSEEALYYARSRYSSSDFDRMRRQQEVITAVKAKAFNLGVVANPVKIFNILDTLESNVRTDMSVMQIKELISLMQKAKVQDFTRAVLDASDDGFLREDRVDGRFVLFPRDESYSQIQELFKNVVERDE